jgi:hypothetical protein
VLCFVEHGPSQGRLVGSAGRGSPTLFVDRTDMYFGNDQLPLVRQALLKAS